MQQHLPSVECRRVALAHLLAPSPIILRSLFLYFLIALFFSSDYIFFWLTNEEELLGLVLLCSAKLNTIHLNTIHDKRSSIPIFIPAERMFFYTSKNKTKKKK